MPSIEHVTKLVANSDLNKVCKDKIFEAVWKLEMLVDDIIKGDKTVEMEKDDMKLWVSLIKSYSEKIQL